MPEQPAEGHEGAAKPQQSPERGPRDLVTSHLAAFNRADVDAVMADVADDATFTVGAQTAIGARAIRTLFADSFASPVGAQLHLTHAVADAHTVACELTEQLTVDDSTHDIDVAAFYTVRDGQLVRVRIYRDLPTA